MNDLLKSLRYAKRHIEDDESNPQGNDDDSNTNGVGLWLSNDQVVYRKQQRPQVQDR